MKKVKNGLAKHLPYLFLAGVIALGLMTIIATGGGDGGGGDGGDNAPSINNLTYSPQSAFLNDSDGSIVVNGNVDFFDSDGDISSYVLTIYDSGNNVVDTLSNTIPGIGGITSGTLTLSVIINTLMVDDYTFSVYLTDSTGALSNTLSGTFPIYGPIITLSNIPDTGLNRCYNQTSVINCPCAGESFYGQDFQYTSNQLNFTDNGDGTVTDNVTALIWQKDDDGLAYNWFEATGSYDDYYNPGSIDVCGSLTLGGYTDWRLPTRRELESIVDYGVYSPAIDTTYFPNTGNFDYWSVTDDSTNARYVGFADGSVLLSDKTIDKHVRCVKGSAWGGNAFVDNGDGTVTDTQSGLIWQWAGQGNCNWQEMLAYCEGLDFAGHTDWRLPDIKELETIVGAEAYLSIGQGVYCSSTTIADDNTSVWLIQFSSTSNYGDVFQHGAGTSKYFCSSFYFRCVR